MPLPARRRRRHHARQSPNLLHRAADVRRKRVPTCRTQQLIAAKPPVSIREQRLVLRLDRRICPTDIVEKGDLTDAIKRVEILLPKLSDAQFFGHKTPMMTGYTR